MRRLGVLLACWLACAPAAWAIDGAPGGTELLAVTNSSTAVTDTLCRVGGVATGAPTGALLEVITGALLYKLDGGTPDTTSPVLGRGGLLEVANASKFRGLRIGSTNATVRVTCYEGARETRVVAKGLPGLVFTCSLDAIAASLTECQAAPGAGLVLYVTNVIAQSTTSTGGQFLLRTGTGTNCGTGTASFLPSAASAVRFAHPANTAGALNVGFGVPFPAPANSAICALGVATNTLSIQIVGYVAP